MKRPRAAANSTTLRRAAPTPPACDNRVAPGIPPYSLWSNCPSLIQKSFGDIPVRVNAAIPQKRPVCPLHVERVEIEFGEEVLFFVDAAFHHDLPGGIAQK